MFSRETIAESKSLLQIQFPANWQESLSNLLESLPGDEFHTVDALLAAIAFDDPTAGNMLKRILHWHGKLGREFYLSGRDWWQQCRVKRPTIERVKAKIFPMCGVAFHVKFTGKANTTWYRLREWHFLRRLSEVIRLPMLCLIDRLCSKPAERSAGIQPNVMSESSATLTIESTINTTNDVVKNNNTVPSKKIVDFKSPLPESTPEQLQVKELLKKAGVQGNRAVAYCLLPLTVVQDCINSAQSAYSAKRTKNRIGYLIGALTNQLKALKEKPTAAPVSQNSTTWLKEMLADGVFEDEPISDSQPDNFAATPPVPTPAEPVNERLYVPINDRDTTPQSAWNTAHQQLRLQMDYGTFNGYFLHAQLVDYEPDCFVVRVQNTHVRDMCQHRFIRTATRILRDVVGREVSIRYEATESPDAPLQRFLTRNK